jgi:hypothetical protein
MENKVNLGQYLSEERKRLDHFNLNVAEYRVQNGMSPQLKLLYREMGSDGENLEMMISKANNIQESFRKIFMKEVVPENQDVPF